MCGGYDCNSILTVVAAVIMMRALKETKKKNKHIVYIDNRLVGLSQNNSH